MPLVSDLYKNNVTHRFVFVMFIVCNLTSFCLAVAFLILMKDCLLNCGTVSHCRWSTEHLEMAEM